MRTPVFLILLLFAASSLSNAQSRSFKTLRDKFSSSEDVFSFRTSGFLSRTLLSLAGEHGLKDAIREVKSIRLLSIPNAAFAAQQVSLRGFKNIVRKDGFEELAVIRKEGNEVNVYHQPDQNSNTNLYLILMQDGEHVTALEIKGYINPEILNRKEDKFL